MTDTNNTDGAALLPVTQDFTYECMSDCGWQGAFASTASGACPSCGADVASLSEIYGPVVPEIKARETLPWYVSSFEIVADGTDRVIMGSDGFTIARLMGRSAEEHDALAEMIIAAVEPRISHSLPGDVGDEEQPGDYIRDQLLNIAVICEAKALHVEAASLRSAAKIVSEQLRKAQQAPEMTRGSVGHVKVLCGLLQEFVEAMERYQMDVDDDAPPRHRDMMERAYAALTPSAQSVDNSQSSSNAGGVSHDRGEPPKLDNGSLPSRGAVGEPECPASSGEGWFYSVGCNRTTVWSGGPLA